MTTNIAEGVSIIIPVHNEEDNIEACINNTRYQLGLSDLEILVVFSGTTDRSREIVARLAQQDLRIKMVESKKGKVNAWNDGRREAKYDFIVFRDGDNRVSLDAIKHAYETLDITGAMAVTGTLHYVYSLREPLTMLLYLDLNRASRLHENITAGCLLGGFYATRKQYLDKVFAEYGFPSMPENVMAEDLWLTQLFIDKQTGENKWCFDDRIEIFLHPNNRTDHIKREAWGRAGIHQVQQAFPHFDYKEYRDLTNWTGNKNLTGKIKIWYNKWVKLNPLEKLWVPLVFPFKKLVMRGIPEEIECEILRLMLQDRDVPSYWDPATSSKKSFPERKAYAATYGAPN